MAHPNLDVNKVTCGIKFYDLKKKPVVCPACGTEFDPEVLLTEEDEQIAKVEEAGTPLKEDDE